jgi:hypothetical protein
MAHLLLDEKGIEPVLNEVGHLSRDPPHDDPASCPICSLIDPLNHRSAA